MRLTSLLAAAATLSLVAAPALARPANPAAKLSLTSAGEASGGAPAKHAKGSTTAIVLAGAAVVAVFAAAVGLSHHDSKAASA